MHDTFWMQTLCFVPTKLWLFLHHSYRMQHLQAEKLCSAKSEKEENISSPCLQTVVCNKWKKKKNGAQLLITVLSTFVVSDTSLHSDRAREAIVLSETSAESRGGGHVCGAFNLNVLFTDENQMPPQRAVTWIKSWTAAALKDDGVQNRMKHSKCWQWKT